MLSAVIFIISVSGILPLLHPLQDSISDRVMPRRTIPVLGLVSDKLIMQDNIFLDKYRVKAWCCMRKIMVVNDIMPIVRLIIYISWTKVRSYQIGLAKIRLNSCIAENTIKIYMIMCLMISQVLHRKRKNQYQLFYLVHLNTKLLNCHLILEIHYQYLKIFFVDRRSCLNT